MRSWISAVSLTLCMALHVLPSAALAQRGGSVPGLSGAETAVREVSAGLEPIVFILISTAFLIGGLFIAKGSGFGWVLVVGSVVGAIVAAIREDFINWIRNIV